MATALYLRVEFDFVRDALDTVERIHMALASRHGSEFRILDAEIDQVIDSDDAWAGDLNDLGEGLLVAQPTATIIDIIRRARAMGVI